MTSQDATEAAEMPANREMVTEGAQRRAENERLRDALDAAASRLPPADWESRDSMGDYAGYGGHGGDCYVPEPDMTNSGDVHAHGHTAGMHALAHHLLAAVADEAEPVCRNCNGKRVIGVQVNDGPVASEQCPACAGDPS